MRCYEIYGTVYVFGDALLRNLWYIAFMWFFLHTRCELSAQYLHRLLHIFRMMHADPKIIPFFCCSGGMHVRCVKSLSANITQLNHGIGPYVLWAFVKKACQGLSHYCYSTAWEKSMQRTCTRPCAHSHERTDTQAYTYIHIHTYTYRPRKYLVLQFRTQSAPLSHYNYYYPIRTNPQGQTTLMWPQTLPLLHYMHLHA